MYTSEELQDRVGLQDSHRVRGHGSEKCIRSTTPILFNDQYMYSEMKGYPKVWSLRHCLYWPMVTSEASENNFNCWENQTKALLVVFLINKYFE